MEKASRHPLIYKIEQGHEGSSGAGDDSKKALNDHGQGILKE
jgi:hypothetical protein